MWARFILSEEETMSNKKEKAADRGLGRLWNSGFLPAEVVLSYVLFPRFLALCRVLLFHEVVDNDDRHVRQPNGLRLAG